MSTSNMSEDEYLSYKMQIRTTLHSIKEITIKIKNELDTINTLVKENGQLHTSLINAQDKLTTVAEKMNINVQEILNNGDGNELEFNLRNVVSSAAFKEKIQKCINDI